MILCITFQEGYGQVTIGQKDDINLRTCSEDMLKECGISHLEK